MTSLLTTKLKSNTYCILVEGINIAKLIDITINGIINRALSLGVNIYSGDLEKVQRRYSEKFSQYPDRTFSSLSQYNGHGRLLNGCDWEISKDDMNSAINEKNTYTDLKVKKVKNKSDDFCRFQQKQDDNIALSYHETAEVNRLLNKLKREISHENKRIKSEVS